MKINGNYDIMIKDYEVAYIVGLAIRNLAAADSEAVIKNAVLVLHTA